MNEGQIAFVEILKDFVNNRETQFSYEGQKELIKHYAKIHQVEAIIYYQVRMKECYKAYIAQIYNSVNREHLLDQLLMQIKNQDYFLIKGAIVAKAYPNPLLRSMGDIDIVVRKDSLHTIDLIMNKNAFKAHKKGSREWLYKKNEISIEVHDRLIYSELFDVGIDTAFFNNCWEYYNNYTIDYNFHYLYLVFHLLKHLMTSGVGIRQFLDIAIVTQIWKLDWDWIQNKAVEIGLVDFFNHVLCFIKYWFDVKTPITPELKDESFCLNAMESILYGGVFGYEDEKNRMNNAINAVRTSGTKGMLKRIKDFVFLPYEKMIQIPGYTFLVDRKYLLIYAWIRRCIEKKSYIPIVIHDYIVNKKDIDERIRFLESWGIK